MKQPRQVFTPRNRDVNPAMYVNRPELEVSLADALDSGLHVLIHGESGSGKSWLYKRVLAEHEISYEVVNLADAARYNSINDAISRILASLGVDQREEFERTGEGSIPGFAKTSQTDKFRVGSQDPYAQLLEHVGKRSERGVVVFDNLESIIDNDVLMDEIGNLITLLDDTRYGQHDVRLVVVGVPGRIRDYFQKTRNRQPVANRLTEVPEVARLNEDQARDLITRGFVVELEYDWPASQADSVLNHIIWVTDRIPQRVHEYCLILANIGARLHRTLRADYLVEADKRWVQSHLSSSRAAIEASMNKYDTKIARRNQVIYTIGSLSLEEFRYTDVEAELRNLFAASTHDVNLNIPQLLADLASRPDPIIRTTAKGDSYRFTDPMHRMAIRTLLEKQNRDDGTGSIQLRLALN